MAYLLSDGGTQVRVYPYNLLKFKQDNSHVSFPRNISVQTLADFKVFAVNPVAPPAYNPLEADLNEKLPVTEDGITWIQAWEVIQADPTVAQARYNAAVEATEAEAKRRLQDAEQYYFEAMNAGYGFSNQMSAYIAALNNPSILPGYPLVSAWPSVPAQKLNPANPTLPLNIYSNTQTDEAIAAALGTDLNLDLIESFEDSLSAGQNAPVE